MQFFNKKFFLSIITLSVAILLANHLKFPIKIAKPPRKKIMIFTSKGGSCHQSTSQALKKLLEKEYDITIINPIEKLIGPLDPVKKIVKKYDWEVLHEKLFQNGWVRTINFYTYYIAPILISTFSGTIEKKFQKLFEKEKPDLVISVIPFFNLFASNAAYKCKIPYALITLDMDLTLWSIWLNKIKHPNFVMTILDDHLKKQFQKQLKNIPQEQIKTIGMPIRPEFFEEKNKKDKEKIRIEWNIPKDKFIIMLMMGGAGSNIILKYAKEIAKNRLPIHLLTCIGKKTKLEKKLLPIIAKENSVTTFTIVPFTNKIADLMSVSDLLITKPGPSTTNEAIAKKLPLLIDETQKTLFWEKGILNFVKRNKIGNSIKKFRKLKKIIRNYLDKNYYKNCLKAFDKLPPYKFDQEIVKIVHQLCPPSLFPVRGEATKN